MLLLARTTPLDEVKKRTRRALDLPRRHAAGASGTALTIRPIRTMMNHATKELFFDDLEVPAGQPRRRGGQGLPLHPRRHERRAHPDRRGVHRRRPLVRRARRGATRSERVVFGRPIGAEPGRAVPDRPGARRRRGGRPDALQGGRAVRARRSRAAPRRTWRSCSPPRRPGRRPTRASTRTAASASPRSTTSSASSARRGCTRSRPISTNLILAYVGQHVLGMPRSY